MLNPRDASALERSTFGLDFRLHLPQNYSSSTEKFPLILLVHGRAGDARVMWLFGRALSGFSSIVISPQAPLVDPLGGYSWWLIDSDVGTASPDRRATTTEQLSPAIAALESFVHTCSAEFRVDARRIIGLGFSQGGALLSSLSLIRPELFSGVALLASFVPAVILDQVSRCGSTKYFIAHGTEDEVVAYSYAERSRDALLDRGAAVEFYSDSVGHKVGSNALRGLKAWVTQCVREER